MAELKTPNGLVVGLIPDELLTSDTRYFVDPSIAAAALGVGPGTL